MSAPLDGQHGSQAPNEDLVAHPSSKPPATNPFAHSANIVISVPDCVEVKLVDASTLADYEVWVLLTSILASAVTGFLVAILQVQPADQGKYTAITFVFAILFLVCIIMALVKRHKLTSKSRRVQYKVGEQIPESGQV